MPPPPFKTPRHFAITLLHASRATLLAFLRSIIAAPSRRTRGPLWTWTARIFPILFALWLFTLGPGSLVMPVHAGFNSVSNEKVTIYFENGISKEMIDTVLSDSETAQQRNQTFWGDPPGGLHRITIYLCSSRARWLQLGLSSEGNALTAGSSLILFPTGIGPRYLAAIICVEMSHAFAAQHVGDIQFSALPCWAEEGLATHLGAPAWSSEAHLKTDLEKFPQSNLVSIATLNTRMRWTSAYISHPPVTLMYEHARSFVEYLLNHYGIERFKEYLREVSFVKNPASVFTSIYHVSLPEADQAWLTETTTANHLPPSTHLITIPLSPLSVAANVFIYTVLSLFALWIVRQCCALARSIGTVYLRRSVLKPM